MTRTGVNPGDEKGLERLDINRSAIASLSIREQQVLSHAADGLLDKQIGAELGVSLNTLRTYWKRIRSKLGDAPRSALAVVYIQHAATLANAPDAAEPEHDWEIDLVRNRYVRVSSRPFPSDIELGADMPLEDIFSSLHPEDEPKIRSLLGAARRGDLTAFHYSFRLILSTGMWSGGAFAQVLPGKDGKPWKIVGRRVPMIDAKTPPVARIEVGYWKMDLVNGSYEADEALCRIFRVDPKTDSLREALLSRFHPDEVESSRTFVSETLKAGRERARSTRRLFFDDGSISWATLDLRIEYEGATAARALGTVMVFDGEPDPVRFVAV